MVSALFALSAADRCAAFVFLPYIPVIVFWGLDGFFLWQEKLYRKLYDHVRLLKDEDVDFSMNTMPFRTSDGPTWLGATFSKTLIPFYGVLIFAVVVVTVLALTTRGG